MKINYKIKRLVGKEYSCSDFEYGFNTNYERFWKEEKMSLKAKVESMLKKTDGRGKDV